MNYFYLIKIERFIMILVLFIFIIVGFLGYFFKLNFIFLYRFWVNIRNCGLCIEEEIKFVGFDISVSFGYS